MGYATIVNGVVTAVSSTPPSSPAVSHVYAGNVAVGWLYSNNTFTPPLVTPPTPPTPPTPTAEQLAAVAAQNALDAGLQIASASTPSLNSTYSTSTESQNNINAVATYALLNNRFPGGASTMPWADKAGNPHVFPSVAVFNAFATAVADYVAAVSLYGDTGGHAGSLPTPLTAII